MKFMQNNNSNFKKFFDVEQNFKKFFTKIKKNFLKIEIMQFIVFKFKKYHQFLINQIH